MSAEDENRPRAFLYIKKGVNEGLTAVARQELNARGVPFREIDLSEYKLDEEWPTLPVVSNAAGFFGNFKSEEDVKVVISFARQPSSVSDSAAS